MRANPLPQEFYKHFKGNLYQIKCIAKHSETGEEMVVYQALYGTYEIYTRPLSMFMEEVNHVKYPNIEQKYRFEKVKLCEAACEKMSTEKVEEKNTKSLEEKNIKSVEAEKLETSAKNMAVQEDNKRGENVVEVANIVEAVDSADTVEAAEDMTEAPLDPKILEFLDARTYEEKLSILRSVHHRLTDDMIDIMSTATDIDVKKGNIEDRYEEFKNCLITLQHFECDRLH